MIRSIFWLAIITIFSIGCEEVVEIKEFPVITTLNPTNVDETGATFGGEVILLGENEITSFGFVWGIPDSDTENLEKIVVGTILSKGLFQTRMNSALAPGFEYKVRAFASDGIKTVYGNTITFEIGGSKK